MRPEVNKIRLTVLIALLFSALCAGVFRTPPILFMAALLTSAPFVSMLFSRLSNRYLRVSRSLPEAGMIGDIITGEISVTNQAFWPTFLIHVCSGYAEGRLASTPRAHQTRRRVNANSSSHAIAVMGNDRQVVPMLRGHSEGHWQQQWLLRRRGVHQVLPTQAGVLDPMGLASRLPIYSQPHFVTVFPRPVRLEQLGCIGGAGLEEQQPRHSTTVADAMDFHGVRPWMPGEAIRRAHWKYTARTGQLHVIEWEESPAMDLAILLDVDATTVAGDEDESTLETAITAAASIAAYLLEHGCRLQIFYFRLEETETEKAKRKRDAKTEPHLKLRSSMAHSVEQLNDVLRALAEVEAIAEPGANAAALLEAASPEIARGMSTLIIASSRASLERRGEAAPIASQRTHALLVDAESFAATPPPDENSRSGQSDPADDRAQVAAGLQLPLLRRRRGFSRNRIPILRRGDPIGAVLEGHI